MPIPFSGAYDRETYFRAIRLFSRPPLWGAALRILLALLVLVVIGIEISGAVAAGSLALGNLATLFFRVGAMLVFVYALISPFIDPYFTARKLWQQAANRSPLAGTLDEREILLNSTGGSRAVGWEQVKRKRIYEDLMILLTAENDLTILPRAFFASEADWQAARALAERALAEYREKPKKKPGKIW